MRGPMRRSALLTVTTTAALLGGASAAQAQDPVPSAPVPSTPTPPSTPVPATPVPATPAPAPVAGQLTIALERVNGRSAAVLSGDRFRVRGTVKPFVAGQRVTVRLYRGTKKLAARSVTLKVTSTGASGTFVVGFTTTRPGHVTVRASHAATPELATAVAPAQGLDVLPLRAKPGAHGLAVRTLQRRLKALGYVTGQPGVLDARTARAVLAFRKVTGMARTSTADEQVFRKLAHGGGAFKVRFPTHGKHVEADLSLQVLALIRGRKVERIYPVSSGKPSTPTVLGSFRVYRKDPGTNAKGMVFSSYFIGGYAIHGYAEVPVYAASHGCLRVPVPDAVPIFNWLKYGDRVDVYP
jgi:peptidoglycan hydrolase-like protein with peptidoglycan-binding domain